MSEPILPDAAQVRPPRRWLTKTLSVILLLIVGIFIGRYVWPVEGGVPAKSPLRFMTVENGQRQLVFDTFWESWDQLHNKFNGELDDEKLFYGAVQGMVQAAGDPYTAFLNPEESKKFSEAIDGSFSGVGVEIGIRKGLLTVIAPLAGSPAEKAGVRQGDIIAAVDRKPITQDQTIDEVVNQIRGEVGTKVTLTVIHPDAQETTDIEIVRDQIKIESVKTKIEEGVAYITITNFNGDTSDRFNQAAQQALDAHVKGIVIDLRNNPGGYLQSAVEIASKFLPAGQVVVSERGHETKEFKASGKNTLHGIPLVVLVNNGSASASEILAGALHDQLDTPLVGVKTFGKGSVQELIKLKDGSSLKVTIAKWFTPKGRNINEEGIEPTVTVEQDYKTDQDEQMDKAKEELQKLISNH